MKRATLISLFVTFVFSSHAQKVLIDKADSDGTRFIATEYVGFSLWCNANSTDTTWMLSCQLNEKREISVGRKLLIKLSDGQIITLENIREIGPIDYESSYWSGSMHYKVFPLYNIEKDDLLSIINKGMIKIRVETNIDIQDFEEGPSKGRTKYLVEEYQNILALLQVKKDLYSDF